MHAITLFALLAAVCGSPSSSGPDGEVPPEREIRQRTLGRFLFRSPALSGNGEVSCATCHDAELSFTDGLPQSKGILSVGVGRNAPALAALRHVRHFPGPRLTSSDPLARVSALTLEDRCLVPIENPLEMGSSLKDVVARLRGMHGVGDMFGAAFGRASSPITVKRIASALGAYVRSLEVPKTPYGEHLAGRQGALSPIERYGLEIFAGRGRCTECHSGPALSDGKLHVVFAPGSVRSQRQARQAVALGAQARASRDRLNVALPQTGIGRRLFELLPRPQLQGCAPVMRPQGRTTRSPYDTPPQGGVTPLQTLSLWDVARTAPYFRDGSATKLSDAVEQHLHELWELDRDYRRFKPLMKAGQARVPRRMRPVYLRSGRGHERPVPETMSNGEVRAVVAFLGALSPR